MNSFSSFAILNGAQLFVDPTDQRALDILRQDGNVHPYASKLWRHALSLARWDYVLDIGANYGEMLVGAPLPPNAAVAAIEPNLRVLPYLVETLRLTQPETRVIPCAVSDCTGEVTLHEDLTWSGNSTLAGEWVLDKADHVWRSVRVPAITLIALLTEIGVNQSDALLMKIDIEGYERKVLQPALKLLSAMARCAFMVEIVRMNDDDLDWLLHHFAISALDLAKGTLVDAEEMSADAFRGLLDRGGLYQRDVIAQIREN